MPNPFSRDESVEHIAGATVETIMITDSELTCEECWEIVTTGEYVPGNKRLTFVCSKGHENIVRGIEL